MKKIKYTLPVTRIKDGLVTIKGRSRYTYGEVVRFENGANGLLFSASEESAMIALLSDDISRAVSVGMKAALTGEIFKITCSEDFIGRIVDYAGRLVPASDKDVLPEVKPNGQPVAVDFNRQDLIYRKSIDRPVKTGILALDALIPIGRGQRELIVGDRQTGKTAIVIDMIVNQTNDDMICIYTSIGKKNAKTVQLYNELKARGAMAKTIFVNASSSENVGAQFVAPYTAMAIAESFQRQGKHVLVAFDDLTKHANAYRTISLLLGRPPGREAYPGDIFFLHSRLLERAGQFDENMGGGSITAMPIVETQGEDFSAYIPTNIVSITDGQIFTSVNAFNNNERPAINIPMSVSRIGGAAQSAIMKKLGMPLKGLISQYENFKKVAKFSGNLSEANALLMKRGAILTQLLIQRDMFPNNYEVENVMIIMFAHNMFTELEEADIPEVVRLVKSFSRINRSAVKLLEFLRRTPSFYDALLLESVVKALYGPLIKKYALLRYEDPSKQIELRRKLAQYNILREDEFRDVREGAR